MKTFKNKLKYISWLAITCLVLYLVFRVLQIINPELSTIQAISKILDYSILSDKNSKLSIGQIGLSLILMVLGVMLASTIKDNIVARLLSKTNLNLGTRASITNLSYYVFIFISFILAFKVANIPLTIFAFLGGAVAIGLGFGSQNILNNFISGIILQTENPMNVGDIIEIEDVRGTVVSIGARSTKLLSSSNTHIILPNSYFLDKRFINWTLYDNKVRSYIKIGYTYKHDPEMICKELLNLVKGLSFIEIDPEPKVLVEEFDNNGIVYGIYVWLTINSTIGRAELESVLRMRIYSFSSEKQLEMTSNLMKVELVKK